ncbi:MAG: biotin/lipoyl-containing protein [Pseudomonadota bacterium]|nr:biotin/lipoyl-containing protein [Pseudomonadota bacterium]
MTKAKLDVDADLVRQLAALLEETDLSEIELGDGDQRVRVVRKLAAGNAHATPAPAATPLVSEAVPPGGDAVPAGAVASPMVGTVYSAPEPGAPAFVTVGARVEEGDTLFVIEAMKVMNPIRAPHGGTVTHIMVENGTPVEFGETLLVLA